MREELYLLATDKINGLMPAIFKFFLFIFSLAYGICVRAILFCYENNIYKKNKLDCKVISIGNITLGGTAKTPLVEFIVRDLKSRGRKVGILSRGYKKDIKKDKASYKSKGDEAAMLALNNPDIPIGIGRDRVKVGRQLILDHGLDTIVLDDGFQHWRLYRDLDIVAIDASYPFGNLNMIPRGILREPLSSLERADIFVITKSDAQDVNLNQISDILKGINPEAVVAESVYEPVFLYPIHKIGSQEKEVVPFNKIENKNVGILCSIANPDYFQQMVEGLGFKTLLKFYYLDHHDYQAQDLALTCEACLNKGVKIIITTEKDAVKLNELDVIQRFSLQILVLKIEFKITKNEEGFLRRLSGIYSR